MTRLSYCSFCGKELILKTLLDGSREKYCQGCDHIFFDAPSPAVIIAVTNVDKVLLTRSVGWKHPYWGLIAGHVRSGETAEDATIREIREEVGLEISDLKILKTYSFIDRALKTYILTIGFTAEAKDIRIRKCKELEKAAWFRSSQPLPLRPNAIATQVVREIFPRIRLIDLEDKGT